MTNASPVNLFPSFDALRAALPAFRRGDEGEDLFFTADWYENLWRHGHSPQSKLLLATFAVGRSGDALCLPLCTAADPRNGCKAAITSLSNYYSSLFGPLGNCPPLGAETLEAIFKTLRATGPRHGLIDLRPLDPESGFFSAAVAALRQAGYWVDTYHCFGNWYLPVGGRSFEQYLPTLPSALRNTIKRGRKKLDRAGRWEIEICTRTSTEAGSPAGEFTAVYNRSWKREEPYPAFIPNLCAMAAGHGWLRLGILRLEGRPIASQIWLVRNGRALIYKLAYDGEFKELSAGSVLSAALMQHVLDVDKVDEVDYLTGDDAYKRDWMSHRRTRRGIIAFDPLTAGGLLAGGRHFAGQALRAVGRRFRPATDGGPPSEPPTTKPAGG